MTYGTMPHPVSGEAIYTALFEAMPGNSILVRADVPRFTVLAATPDYLKNSGQTKATLIGKGLFEAFPPNRNDPRHTGDVDLLASFQRVLDQREADFLPLHRYDLQLKDGSFSERYWSIRNKPVFDPNSGAVSYIMHTAEGVEQQPWLHETITSNTPDLIYLFDLNYRFTYANKALLSMWGKSWSEAIGKGLLENGYAPWHAEMHQREIDQVIATKTPVRGEVSFPHAILGNRIYDYIFVPVMNEAGIVEAIAGTTRDITEIRQASVSVRKRERQQQLLLQLNDVLRKLNEPVSVQYEGSRLVADYIGADRAGFAEDSGDGATVEVTVDYARSGPSLKGKYTYEDYGPGLISALRAGQTVTRTDISRDQTLTPQEREAHAALGLGATLNVPILKDEALTAIFFMHFREARDWSEEEVALLRDVGARTWEAVIRTRAEQALRESEARFRLMADAVPLSMWITDNDGQVEFMNQHWWDYCGAPASLTTANEIAARHLHPEDSPRVLQAFETARQAGTSFEVEQRNRSCHGEYRWFLNRATPYRDPATGEITKWFGVGIDIHDRKQAEQALRESEEALEKKVLERTFEWEKANEELKRSNQHLEEFAHAASHDLKEPIRKIHFFTHQLKGQLRDHLKEADARSFDRIENATERMGHLIDDLLLYSHVSQRPHQTEAVDLNEKIQRVVEDLELDIEERHAEVLVAGLPVVQGYKRQLQQLFQNLLSNALKYSKPDVPPRIEITGAAVEEHGYPFHSITVRDNGIGFEPQYADRIFQMFTRLHGRSEYSGTGVGLSIVKKVVENHNGMIRVESKPGEGSAFTILLPAQ